MKGIASSAPRGYGEQGNLQFFLWEHGNMSKFFKGTWEQSGVWGEIWNFFEGNSQKAFLGIRAILEIFLGNTGIQTPMEASKFEEIAEDAIIA